MKGQEEDRVIRTHNLVLRHFQAADAERVCVILNHPQVGPMISRIPLPYPLDAALAWLETHAGERADNSAFRFGVEKDNYLIGCVDVADIKDSAGELGFWFDPAFSGIGYAFEAAEAVLTFAFERLNLTTLTANRASDNAASGKLLARLGFRSKQTFETWSESRQQTITQVSNRLDKADWGIIR